MDQRKSGIPDEHHRHTTGEWLPQDHRAHQEWLGNVSDQAEKSSKELHPCLKEFKDNVNASTRLSMLCKSMFDQVPKKHPYNKSVDQKRVVRDLDHLLVILNHIISNGPEWTEKSHRVGVVGVPINAVLDYNMGTSAGFAFFLDPEVNVMIKKILDVWGEFLQSEESAKCLQGWFEHGVESLSDVANKATSTNKKFEELFVCNPSEKYYGYKSWDDFFTRPLREGARPVASPEDDNVIANACESKPYRTAHNIQLRDKFWIKGQPYSAIDMLDHDQAADQFVGGTVYQAFLSALSYHRWHAPVSGKIVKKWIVPGAYYSEPQFEDFTESHGADVRGQTPSQGYLSAVATRAIMYIEADNPKIGLMAVIAIGMTEVSTCVMTVEEGQHIKKGEQLGHFRFGGSTHCLMFRKGVKVSGFPKPGCDHNIPVRSQVAVVEN